MTPQCTPPHRRAVEHEILEITADFTVGEAAPTIADKLSVPVKLSDIIAR